VRNRKSPAALHIEGASSRQPPARVQHRRCGERRAGLCRLCSASRSA